MRRGDLTGESLSQEYECAEGIYLNRCRNGMASLQYESSCGLRHHFSFEFSRTFITNVIFLACVSELVFFQIFFPAEGST